MIEDHLRIALCAAVPLHIMVLKAQGGPSQKDVRDCEDIALLLGEKADRLLFGENRDEAAEIFNQLARGIAIFA